MRVAAGAAAPASNTRSKIAARAAIVKRSTRPSCLIQPTISSKAEANSGTTNTVEIQRDNRRLRQLTRRIIKMEIEVHQAMSVTNAES